MSRLELALQQLTLARSYTLNLLSDIPEKDWFWMPEPGVTHVAWQVGHLTIAQYLLCLVRIRGTRAEDQQWFPREQYEELFGRITVPRANTVYPSPAELLATLDRVAVQARTELELLTDKDLDQPNATLKPHPIVTTKLSALLWCAHHEFLHTGQIGLLRRMLGAAPKW